MKIINNGFSEKIAKGHQLQQMYESQKSEEGFLEPTELINEVNKIISDFRFNEEDYKQTRTVVFQHKETIPKKQLLALYAINKITSIANKK